jgi:hypothetical protein
VLADSQTFGGEDGEACCTGQAAAPETVCC